MRDLQASPAGKGLRSRTMLLVLILLPFLLVGLVALWAEW